MVVDLCPNLCSLCLNHDHFYLKKRRSRIKNNCFDYSRNWFVLIGVLLRDPLSITSYFEVRRVYKDYIKRSDIEREFRFLSWLKNDKSTNYNENRLIKCFRSSKQLERSKLEQEF